MNSRSLKRLLFASGLLAIIAGLILGLWIQGMAGLGTAWQGKRQLVEPAPAVAKRDPAKVAPRKEIADFRKVWKTPLQGRVQKSVPIPKPTAAPVAKVRPRRQFEGSLVGVFLGSGADRFGVFRLPNGIERVVRLGQSVEELSLIQI